MNPPDPIPPEFESPSFYFSQRAKIIEMPMGSNYLIENSEIESVKLLDEPDLYLDDKPKETSPKPSPYDNIVFILYMLISTVVIFGFLIKINDPIKTLVYFLIQALYIIAIGTIIYWMVSKGAKAWSWILAILSLVIQILWVFMVVYY